MRNSNSEDWGSGSEIVVGGSQKHRRRRRQTSDTTVRQNRPRPQDRGNEGSALTRIKALLTDANSAFKWVAGVAAGVVAIAAVVALLRPKASPAPNASFGSVEVETGQTLDEFSAVAKQVFASFVVPSTGRVVLVADHPETLASATPVVTGDPGTGGTTPGPTSTGTTNGPTATGPTATGPTATAPPTSGPSTTGTSATGTTATGTSTTGTTTTGTTTTGTTGTTTGPNIGATRAGRTLLNSAFGVPRTAVITTGKVIGGVGNAPQPLTVESATTGVANPGDVIVVPPVCTSGHIFQCGLTPEIGHQLARGISPLAAARQVDQIFRDARVVHQGRRAYPLGLIVNFDLTLVGFGGRVGTLTWNVTRVGGAQAQAPWWDQFEPAYDVAPHNSPWSRFLSLWIPEPSRLGTYDVSLYYTVGDQVRGRVIEPVTVKR